MDGQHGTAAEIHMGLHTLLRQHVNLAPQQVVGAGFDQGQVKGAQSFANLAEAVEVTAVTTKENVSALALYGPAGP